MNVVLRIKNIQAIHFGTVGYERGGVSLGGIIIWLRPLRERKPYVSLYYTYEGCSLDLDEALYTSL